MEKIHILEWNINQRGGNSSDIPMWIVDEFEESHIVVLTEFCRKGNWQEFINETEKKGYNFVFSENSIGNDILIAVKKSCSIIGDPIFVLCGGRDDIPENLRVDIRIGDNMVSVLGVRIKDLGRVPNRYTKKKIEMQWLMEWIKDITNPIVIAGDFKNNRRGTIEKRWNLDVLDKCLLPGFARKTPAGSSIYEEKAMVEFPEDHFLIRGVRMGAFSYCREFCERHKSIYPWGKDFQLYMGKDISGNVLRDSIPAGYPDHAILKGEILTFDMFPHSDPLPK